MWALTSYHRQTTTNLFHSQHIAIFNPPISTAVAINGIDAANAMSVILLFIAVASFSACVNNPDISLMQHQPVNVLVYTAGLLHHAAASFSIA